MKITILTIFPDMFESILSSPLISRSIENRTLEIEIVDIRNFADGSFRHIDDSPYGGGTGMLLKCEPVFRAYDTVHSENAFTIAFTPSGKTYNQKIARSLLEKEHIILLCGHYEGMDERIYDLCDTTVSIGDYVLSGGEIPAMVIMDSLARLMKGTIREGATEDESFENDLLEYPQYTKPAEFHDKKVPDVLLSGNHEAIRKWKMIQSLKKTKALRPDLLEKHVFTEEEKEILEIIKGEENVV